jgi:hypothetical protein
MMLITFSSAASANITMLEGTAHKLLELMGQSNKVPGALLAKDIPAALAQLEAGIEQSKQHPASEKPQNTNSDEPPVTLANQAFPIILLLKAAVKNKCDLIWSTSSKLNTGI